jgi:hypothetical protein
MFLRKTTILPADDAELAVRLFREVVHNYPYHVFVVLPGRDAETVVQRADNLTGQQADPRWVIWARAPKLIEAELDTLKNSDRLKGRLATAHGFSLSLSDEVRDVIGGDEDVPNLTRILLAFANAEQIEES